ncbi:hypothetical protein TNCV_3453161 [Trichonephila clavipes]|nr:hypothetical protein TNCV_3453161 [Trichonephila clavipes]
MTNYSKCPLFAKPRKGAPIKQNYTDTINSIVRPNLSYAQATQKTSHSATPQQMAPPGTNTVHASQHMAQEPIIPSFTPTLSHSKRNECFNLITQTLQHTIQALIQLIQRNTDILTLKTPLRCPTTVRKNKTNAKHSKENINKILLQIVEKYLDEYYDED